MHFAYPSRKASHPPPYASRPNWSTFINSLQRVRRRSLAISALAFLAFFYILSKIFASAPPTPLAVLPPAFIQAPQGQPNVVIVTTINRQLDPFFTDSLKQNRVDYAARYGYATFFPNTTDYKIGDSPQSWSKIPAMRHAMTLFPQTPYFFFLDDHTVITNPSLSVEGHIMNPTRLETLMIKDIPVVPPDSVIKTFSNIPGDRVDFVLTQDKDGLGHNSFILRQGDWATYFLDAWFDPLYRSYNFQKAERHALEHIVQWHGTLLAKIALVPQKIMNSYTQKDSKLASQDGIYKEDDFILHFGDCDSAERSCELEMRPWFKKSTD